MSKMTSNLHETDRPQHTAHLHALLEEGCKNLSKEKGAGTAEGSGMNTVSLILI